MTTISAAPAVGRLERRKARTRAAIITAASKLFHERGYEDTSIQQIAELADTGVGTLYGYFDSKDDILREVLQTARDEALERYSSEISETSSYTEKACLAIQTLATYLRSQRTILLSAVQVATRTIGPVEDAQAEWLHAAFKQMIAEGIAAGEFRDLPLDSTVRMLVGTTMMAMLGIGTWKGLEDDPQTVADLEALTRAVLGR